MPKRAGAITVAATGPGDTREALAARFAAVREEFGVVADFPADVVAEAERAVASVRLPDRDETSVPFVTIDPPGSMDLDQALHIERDGDGHRVRYAIADVPGFVAAGGAVDAEARRRGQTVYAPDGRAPLHPAVLSEGAASLLEGQERPAFVWDLRLDGAGVLTSAEVFRARVRSTARLDYAHVQEVVDAGTAPEVLVLLKEVGERRVEQERLRGGASLPMPEQEVVDLGEGRYGLEFRPPVAAEEWNAQISLLTGMAAAEMMLAGGVGILRTMPPPDHNTLGRFRRQAKALGVDWPQDQPYGDLVRGLDRDDPKQLALVYEATSLFRGAGYTPFGGAAGPVPAEHDHAAVASAYAHVTAPLRRLVDRFGLAVCAALSAGEEPPAWAVEALPLLPDLMRESDRRAGAVERACQDAVEAAVLSTRVGEELEGVAVDRTKGGAVVQLIEPAVVAKATGEVAEGTQVRVRVDGADVSTGRVDLELVF